KQIDPDLLDRVKLYQAETALFDEYDIEAEIRSLFKPRVELPTGGYLIIQPTEALTSIDVSTGRDTGKKAPESTSLTPNVGAARCGRRWLRAAGAEHKHGQLAVPLHPDVALCRVAHEPNCLRQPGKQTGVEPEVRDDPMVRLGEFRMMADPAGSDVTEQYAVA